MLRVLHNSRDHLGAVGESYGEHLGFATRTGAVMIGAGLACAIHGLMPFLFVSTGSRTIRSLAAMLERRSAASHGSRRSPASRRGGMLRSVG